MGPECVFFFWFHSLESGRLGTVLGVVGAPAALYRYTSLRFHAQTHQNGPARLLSPGTRCCSTGGFKLFMKHFHSQRCTQCQPVGHFLLNKGGLNFAGHLNLELCWMEFCIQFGQLIGLHRGVKPRSFLSNTASAQEKKEKKRQSSFSGALFKNPVNYAPREVW